MNRSQFHLLREVDFDNDYKRVGMMEALYAADNPDLRAGLKDCHGILSGTVIGFRALLIGAHTLVQRLGVFAQQNIRQADGCVTLVVL